MSRTARDQIDELEDDDAWFEAWSELRRIQHGEATVRCRIGQFANYWCASGRIGFRVSRPGPRSVLIWRVLQR